MRILKLLNRNYLSIILIIFLISLNVEAQDEPIDIWNIDQTKIEEDELKNNQISLESNDKEIAQPSIFDTQPQKEI